MTTTMIKFISLTLLTSFTLAKLHPEAKLYFTDYCQYFNYPSQIHNVVTDDGYILTYFRIQAKNTNITEGLPPILMQHGLLDCSDTFIINDEEHAIGFVLANAGYDVWFGNNRGNKHCLKHQTYSQKQSIFWDFSFEDMAIHDLPAGFQYIHNHTNQQIIYIGHSQGTMQMHVHLSLFKDSPVRSYLKQFIGLGPVAFVSHQSSFLVGLLLHSPLIEILDDLGINEFMQGDTWITSDVGRIVCGLIPSLCNDLIGSITSADKDLDNYERYDVLAGHDPAGTSVKNLKHWKQFAQTGKFQRYDYGDKLNKRIYNQTTPPEMDLKNIDLNIYYICGKQDLLADPQDVEILVGNLTNSVVWHQYYDAGHCTYMWGKQTPWISDILDIIKGKI